MKKLLCVVLLYILTNSISAAEKLDGIVAIVGDSAILASELEAYVFLRINQLGTIPDSLERDILRSRCLDELIEGKVLLVHAEKDTNITVSNDDVEGELKTRIAYILRQNRISNEELEVLLEKEQGISLTKFKKELRQQIRQELLKQKVQQFYVSSSKMNRGDIEKFYKEYKDSLPSAGESIRLSKIIINTAPSEKIRQNAYTKIMSLKEMLDNGQDFSSVAKLHSEGLNAENGGDLGYITKGTLGELLFEEKIFSLKPGETSEPFESRLGFHIVNIIDRKDQKVHVRQIFVSITPPEEEIKKIVSLLDSVKTSCTTPEAFRLAVEKYSTDNASKSRKGQLGWQSLSEIDPDIRSAFDTLTIGAISSTVTKDNTISLYRIDDLVKSRKLTLTEDWNEITQIAERIYMQKKLMELVSKWQQETYIDIRL